MPFRCFILSAACSTLFAISPVRAAEVQITGKVVAAGGHQNPSCRQIFIKRNDNGQVVGLRLPNISGETSLSAIAITALTTGLSTMVDYDTAVTSGCGTEPAIIWMNLLAPGQ